MKTIDWAVLSTYLIIILAMGFLVGRRQKSQKEYYVAGESLPWWQIGLSLVANQVSAVSLIGAPAFIAMKNGGGLKWLQYEMAVPLAMIPVIIYLLPAYWKSGGVTIYQFLEERFGVQMRLAVGFIFMLSRSMGTGVALLATSYVTAICLDMDMITTILIVGTVSVIYTIWGGIRADIYSDIIQLGVLWGSSILCIGILWWNIPDGGMDFSSWGDRLTVFELSTNGITDGASFSIWPMLIGGFFLYLSYYGCDQTQAQRLLAATSQKESEKAVVFNGILRYPLVLTYCAAGVLMLPFLNANPDFASSLSNVRPDYLMPYFFIRYVPSGLLGIIVAGVFAASMSSIDSSVNSLSASTWNDFILRLKPGLSRMSEKVKVFISRMLSALWGAVSIFFAIWLGGGHDTVIELINKIGSAFYGPVAAVFMMGIVSKRIGGKSALAGLAAGILTNIYLWLAHSSSVSWLWWNFTGFAVTAAAGLILSGRWKCSVRFEKTGFKPGYVLILILWFFLIVISGIGIETVFQG